jgi:hypothetical protein
MTNIMKWKLSWRIKRLRVKWRQWRKSINDTIKPGDNIVTPFAEKSIRLWKLLLKDKTSKMGFNTWGIRQIERGNLLIVFQHNPTSESIMTIMDINDSSHNIYELHINIKQSMHVAELFDNEMDKRMNESESKKRNIIETDLDKLLQEEENKYKPLQNI